ncbi:wax ester/triacylglycerol synthase domain-containing protein [Rhodococcus chondri]|uniref:Wax ester/triacylglycerol synthase family O-acyltransferase n=1 Tax=Rhodococcus chondri TaxID=3065941 RepID=A0ABU7JX09_9NOCA|nr:wax ester/triacylglycerol synthase domain-containing protein [Rhodococcus sp. CC-R104]MEE2034049.1 wax ester/triacylglycerol synthase family O-acyltransferase [Rhodococcus sp. CC-R104]
MTDAKDLRPAQPDEGAPRSAVVAVALLDATPDWDRVAAVLAPANPEASTFRHRVLEMPFGLEPPRRPGDPYTDPSWHLERVELPSPATIGDVLDFARAPHTAPEVDHARWDLTLVDGLTGGQAALLIRLRRPSSDASTVAGRGANHGAAGNGASAGTEGSVWSWLRALSDYGAESIRAATGLAVGTATDLVRTVLSPATASPRPVGAAQKSRFHAFAAPLDELRETARRVGCSVESGFAAATLLGYAEYLRARDIGGTPSQATLAVPGTDATRMELPEGTDDAVGLMHRFGHSGAASGSLYPDDAYACTVPGSSAPLYVGGAKIERYYGFGSTADAAFHATLMPYRDTCCIGVTATAAALPDRAEFDECLRAGIRLVLQS